MENSVGSHDVVVDDPEQACIDPADDPSTLAVALDGGSGNNWYWTSMLNLVQSSSSSTHTTGQAPSQFSTGQHSQVLPAAPAAASSPSSSSVHDQPIEMLTNNSNLSNDPESAVWGQEFLSGPIGEGKPSIHACSDDGLQELLYPRTVRELLFSDQLKLDQSPTWDIQPAAKSFAFPLGPDKMSMAMAVAHHNLNADIKPAHALLHHHHYSHLSVDDRLSSSTASSTLSDNTTTNNNNNIDQWAAPNSAQCDQQQARTCSMHVPNSMLQQQQQFDHSRVKQEYNTLPIPIPYTNYPKSNSSISPFLLHHHHHHQNQRLINPNHAGNIINEAMINVDHKPNNKLWPPPPAALIHARFEHASLPSPSDHCLPKHPNELVAFSSSVPLRQGGFDANYFQPEQLMQQVHGGVITSDRHINTPLQYISPASHIGKKSRPMEAGQVDDAKELVPSDQKPNIIPGSCDKQLSEEYNFKRSRVEQQPPPTSTFKSQPVRKEKIGERITTLQQLVSPFGKTDTASVLLEAIGYIKFLQEQVQALSSPYFKTTSSTTAQNGDRNQNADESKPDLRSRGLCLVPLSCTMQVANDNGADYWYGGAFR